MKITLTVNGDSHTLDHPATVQSLLQALSLENKRLAIECNQDIIPRSEYAQTQLNDGDKIEIIHAVGGG